MGRAFEYRKAAKEKRWGAMSRIFPKLGAKITIAAKMGGDNPETNAALKVAIANAKAANVPKNVIQSAIKRASSKEAGELKEIHYECKCPYGVLMYIECASDNLNRTVAEVKNVANKNGGNIIPSGSLEFIFQKKAVIVINDMQEEQKEELELELIDYGLEDIKEENDYLTIYADYKYFGELCEYLSQKNILTKEASLRRIADNNVELNEEQFDEMMKLVDKLEELDDVVQVSYNFD